MSTALELVQAGRLAEALAALQQEVRQQPGDARLRVFLFQLLAVLGQRERALTQLDTVRQLDVGAIPMVQAYGEALRCEALRDEVFAGTRTPVILGEPEPWMAQLMQALSADAQGDHALAQKLRGDAFESAPTASGSLDGERFEWIADADGRLGPLLEALINGRYYWVPLHRLSALNVEAPVDLRDAVWMPAHFHLRNGGDTAGFIPTRYAGTTGDEQLLLARRTEWVGSDEAGWRGVGQRMIATDAGEYPLMEIREIKFDAAAS